MSDSLVRDIRHQRSIFINLGLVSFSEVTRLWFNEGPLTCIGLILKDLLAQVTGRKESYVGPSHFSYLEALFSPMESEAFEKDLFSLRTDLLSQGFRFTWVESLRTSGILDSADPLQSETKQYSLRLTLVQDLVGPQQSLHLQGDDIVQRVYFRSHNGRLSWRWQRRPSLTKT